MQDKYSLTQSWLLRWSERFWGFALGLVVAYVTLNANSIVEGVAILIAVVLIDYAYNFLAHRARNGT